MRGSSISVDQTYYCKEKAGNMKIMLVNPPNGGRSIPEEEYGITSIRQIFRGEPLSLEVLAGSLGSHDVTIVDLKCEAEAYLWQQYDSFQPEVVGFTAVTCEANQVFRLSRDVKRHGEALVVVGGIHATLDPSFFNCPGIDYVVIGLGKKSFSDLIDGIALGRAGEVIPGVAKTSPGQSLVFTPRRYGRDDLMEDDAPRYDLVEQWRDRYVIEQLGLPMGCVVTAYGCTHRCSFCTIPGMTGGQYLTHQTSTVMRDLKCLGEIPFVRMTDANTFGSPQASEELCEAILASSIKKRFLGDVRVDTIVRHPSLLKRWKEAGLFGVVVGFEDLQPERLRAYEKKYDEGTIRQAVSILHELGLLIVGDFIIAPDYWEEDFRAVEDFIVRNKIQLPVLTVLTPVPGTPLYRSLKDRITIHNLDYYTFTNSVVATMMPEKVFYSTYSELVRRLHSRVSQ
ncbi:MAG: B12-binding domain-containing radical SAM protein [Syntrophales bacterium LBB04]|nr:B12-binding domain-containing radical SAM protein [Syntrophales bacterium LBB04]